MRRIESLSRYSSVLLLGSGVWDRSHSQADIEGNRLVVLGCTITIAGNPVAVHTDVQVLNRLAPASAQGLPV